MIKAAVVGVTGFGLTHYGDLIREYKAGRVQPVAAVIVNPDDAQEQIQELTKIGCDILPDFDTLIAKYSGKLDICCIPTGIALHKPMTVAALEAGFNVFVEKPVAATKADADAMAETAKRTGKFAAVGYQTMYQPETRRIKELCLSGVIGNIRQFKCYALWPRAFSYYNRNRWAGKLFADNGDIVLDSPFTNALAHDLNLLLFYAGKSFRETAVIKKVQGTMLHANDIQSCDVASIRAVTEDDKEILFTVAHSCNQQINPTNEIIGDKGVIRFHRNENPRVTVCDNDGNIIEEFPYTPNPEIRKNIWDKLLARINDPEVFVCDASLAATHTLVCNAIFDSVKIAEVPADRKCVVSFNETDDRRTVIPGIEKAVRDSYEQGRLLDECDLPFAQKSEEFSLENYSSFDGRLYGKR